MSKFGISVASLTPFTETGEVDLAKLCRHVRNAMKEGVSGVTLFGTTGEGASIGRHERNAVTEAILATGIPPEKIVIGVAATSVEQAITQISDGFSYGVHQFLLTPPFYFKGCSDDGLFDWFIDVVKHTDPATRFIIYHIPQVTGVSISLELVSRLVQAAPNRFSAIKDSSGSWDNAVALLKQNLLPVLVGDERLLHKASALGAAGSICGMANLYPARMVKLFETQTEDTALSDDVTQIVSVPFVPALKAIIAERSGDAGWERLRAPITALPDEAKTKLLKHMEAGNVA